MTDLARMIRRHRVQQRLTQAQASDQADISLATWQSLERESVDPDRFQDLTLAAVADGLGVPLATVFDWARRPLPEPDRESSRPPPDVSTDEQIDQLAALLRRLASMSEISYLLAYGQAVEIADHLVQLHEPHPDLSP